MRAFLGDAALVCVLAIAERFGAMRLVVYNPHASV